MATPCRFPAGNAFRARVVVWALALTAAASSCDGEAKTAASLTYTEDAHAAYQEAMEAYEEKDWEDARALFEEVKRLFSYSRYAKLAELRIADIDFEQGKFSDAISSYRAFVKSHRGDDNVEYAKYRIAKALFLDINDTILLPPQEERDQANTRDAHRELKAFVRRFPKSRYRVDAEYMLEMVTQRLVRHELYVARYYLREDRFQAAVARCQYALDNFAGSGLDAEAMVLKGETLLKMDEDEEARETFEQVILQYGGPFGVVAKRFLAMMGHTAPELGTDAGTTDDEDVMDDAPSSEGTGGEASGSEASAPR
jgi:outer membrane protein assembly factor BamD